MIDLDGVLHPDLGALRECKLPVVCCRPHRHTRAAWRSACARCTGERAQVCVAGALKRGKATTAATTKNCSCFVQGPTGTQGANGLRRW
jgi:hypothetical protein